MNQVLAVGFLLIGSYIDSRAIIYASEIWADGQFHLRSTVLSCTYFTVGFFAYIAALRFLTSFGLTNATLQVIAAVVVTTVLTAVMSGDLRTLTTAQVVAGLLVLAGVAYLTATIR